MLYFILAGLLFIITLCCLEKIVDFWIWVAYDRHGYYRILEDRPFDNFIYSVCGWFSVMIPLVFLPLYLVCLGAQ